MKIHIVKKGDTIWDIAKKYGVDFEEVKELNPQISSPDMIMPGMKIKIPSTTKPVKKETAYPKEKQQPIKEQSISPKPTQMIQEDDKKKPKEVKIEKPIHSEIPELPEYPKHEDIKKETHEMAEMPKTHEHPKKEKTKTPENFKMPDYPKMELPLGTYQKHEKSMMPGHEQFEYVPQHVMPMNPCCCQMMQPPPYQPCCQHMYHHPWQGSWENIENMHPTHPIMHHPQEMGQQQMHMPGYPMRMGQPYDVEQQKGTMYPQYNWQSNAPSHQNFAYQQDHHTAPPRKDEEITERQSSPSQEEYRDHTNHSFPTPPIYPNFPGEMKKNGELNQDD